MLAIRHWAAPFLPLLPCGLLSLRVRRQIQRGLWPSAIPFALIALLAICNIGGIKVPWLSDHLFWCILCALLAQILVLRKKLGSLQKALELTFPEKVARILIWDGRLFKGALQYLARPASPPSIFVAPEKERSLKIRHLLAALALACLIAGLLWQGREIGLGLALFFALAAFELVCWSFGRLALCRAARLEEGEGSWSFSGPHKSSFQKEDILRVEDVGRLPLGEGDFNLAPLAIPGKRVVLVREVEVDLWGRKKRSSRLLFPRDVTGLESN